MLSWKEILIEQQRRQDEIAQAAQVNYIKQVLQQPSWLKRTTNHLLTLLGNQLVEWGHRLQKRCAVMAYTSSNQSAHPKAY